jgi:predicted esterase
VDDLVEIRHLAIRRHARYALLGTPESPSQLWFGLHGYGHTAPRFARYMEVLDDGSRLVVAPEGLHRHYLDHEARKVGASWMTSEDRLTDIDDYVAYLDRLHGRVLDQVGGGDRENGGSPGEARDGGAGDGDPGGTAAAGSPPVVALGFSQGVHTLCRWLAFGEARIDTAVLWGADVPPDLELEAHGEAMAAARILLVAGHQDPHFGPREVEAVGERLSRHGVPFETVSFAGGHRLDDDVLERIAAEATGG